MDKICGCLWGSCLIFTGTDSLQGVRVQACLRCAGPGSRVRHCYRITPRLPEASQKLQTQTKVRKSVVFFFVVVLRLNLHVILPSEPAGAAPLI